jgi:hypothetical protein
MHKNNNKSTSVWTKKHDAFCLNHGFTPSAKLLWQWLVHKGEGQELEPDLQEEFNKWVLSERGKAYDPKTLKSAIKQLDDCAIINVLRKFSWKIYKIFLRPLDWLAPKKKSRKSESISNKHPSNYTEAEDGVNNNNNTSFTCEEVEEMEQVLTACEEAGIAFNPQKSPEILDYTIEEVNLAIKCFIAAGGNEVNRFGRRKIRNPQGWLIQCLRNAYWEQVNSWSFAGLIAALGIQKQVLS